MEFCFPIDLDSLLIFFRVLMPAYVVVGLQWGDEGKGKIVDLLAQDVHFVVRSQGGNNAGHTIVRGNIEHRFHLVPSGILFPHTKCLIAGGTVIDPAVLWDEIERLESSGVSVRGRLHLSPYAHVIFPFHKELDLLSEKDKGKAAIGTTGRGIGPCYVDKAARVGIRIADLLSLEDLRHRLEFLIAQKNRELTLLYGQSPISFEDVYKQYTEWGRRFREFVAPVEKWIQEALKKGKHVLFEGAHGSLLDLTYGTFPFVTSSSTFPSGVLGGAACFSSAKMDAIGIVKAYSTRVGGGPLPTELTKEEISFFPPHGVMREVGTTTGRKRRIGWLDLFLIRHVVQLSGVRKIALTKLDILDGLLHGKVCIGYRYKGKMLDEPPIAASEWDNIEPLYEEFQGWGQSITDCKAIDQLPFRARQYLEKIETFCGVETAYLSLGPDHNQTLCLQSFLSVG